jgi:PleD family two-component response regulator
VSVGWATWEGDDLGQLLARADGALYEAKDAGRNCVRPRADHPT